MEPAQAGNHISRKEPELRKPIGCARARARARTHARGCWVGVRGRWEGEGGFQSGVKVTGNGRKMTNERRKAWSDVSQPNHVPP